MPCERHQARTGLLFSGHNWEIVTDVESVETRDAKRAKMHRTASMTWIYCTQNFNNVKDDDTGLKM